MWPTASPHWGEASETCGNRDAAAPSAPYTKRWATPIFTSVRGVLNMNREEEHPNPVERGKSYEMLVGRGGLYAG